MKESTLPSKTKTHRKYTFEDVKRIYTKKHLEYVLGEKYSDLQLLAQRYKSHYHPYDDFNPKKKKPRHIDNPDRMIKRIQQKIDKRILRLAPLPAYILGGVKDKSIIDNIRSHLHKDVVVTIDLKNCFPRTSNRKVYSLFKNVFNYSNQVASLLTKITTFEGHIPQGGKSSTCLINLILVDMCDEIYSLLASYKIDMTIWVDDITFSGKQAEKFIGPVIKIIQSYGYSVSNKKIKVMRKGKHQEVTGLTVNEKPSVPKGKLLQWQEEMSQTEITPKIKGRLEHLKFVNSRQYQKMLKLLRLKGYEITA